MSRPAIVQKWADMGQKWQKWAEMEKRGAAQPTSSRTTHHSSVPSRVRPSFRTTQARSLAACTPRSRLFKNTAAPAPAPLAMPMHLPMPKPMLVVVPALAPPHPLALALALALALPRAPRPTSRLLLRVSPTRSL
jgi:hypothetical protein